MTRQIKRNTLREMSELFAKLNVFIYFYHKYIHINSWVYTAKFKFSVPLFIMIHEYLHYLLDLLALNSRRIPESVSVSVSACSTLIHGQQPYALEPCCPCVNTLTVHSQRSNVNYSAKKKKKTLSKTYLHTILFDSKWVSEWVCVYASTH